MMKKLVILIFLALICPRVHVFAQNLEIKGKVTDSKTGAPLVGVLVASVGQTDVYSVTDNEGGFVMTINGNTKQLNFSYLGYTDVIVDITGSTVYDVKMTENVEVLSEVVVTALGISREKKTLGYAIQEVDSEELTRNKSTNIINSLQGKVAGVQITSGGSALGSSSRIVIRGNGGFSGNSPLWVVDGVPVNSGSTALQGAGGIDFGSNISDLDQNNIESITVLKGASASALYGSRAINGVIVVTTKQPDKKGKRIGVELNSSFVGQVPSYFAKYQNEYGTGLYGDEYSYHNRRNNSGELYSDIYSTYNDYLDNEVYKYVDGRNGINESALSWGGRLDAGLFLDQWSTGPKSPWVSRPDNYKYWFDTGYDIENNIAISANGEKASARISYTNLTSTGIIPYTDQSQNSISVNTRINPVKWLSLSANVNYVNKKSDNLQAFGYSAYSFLAWQGRDMDVKHLRDIYEKEGKNEGMVSQTNNHFWALDNITNSFNRERLYGNVAATFTITDWLNIVARYGMDSFTVRKQSVVPSTSWSQINKGKNGQFSRSNNSYKEDNADVFINFDKEFGKIRVDGFLGGNYRYLYTVNESMSAPDLTVPDLFVMSNVKGTPGVSNSMTRQKSYSVFFAANFSYDDWLFVGVTGRNDWNSTLPVDNSSYFYPALNVSFSITDAFDIKSDILTYAKPRFNIAQVGGATSPYRLQEVYGLGKFNDVVIMNPATQYPPFNLKPQMATSWEVGADIRMFKGRVSLDMTYYERTTRNMIMSVPISRTTGYASMLINAGEIFNRGFELMIGGQLFENRNGFNWDLNFNFATNKNIVKKLYPGVEQYQIAPGYGGCTVVAVEGGEWGQLYGMAYNRNDNGEIINDNNGMPKIGQAEYLGKITPDWTGGITSLMSYKGFSLSAVIDMSFGSQFFSVTKWNSYPTGAFVNTVTGGVRENGIIGPGVLEVVDAEGNISYKPNDIRLSAQDYFRGMWWKKNQEYAVMDGSYIKLRELSLGYQFNFKDTSPVKSIYLAFTCRNVAILYRSKECRELGIDPETQLGGTESGVGLENFNLPGTRAYGVKMNIKF